MALHTKYDELVKSLREGSQTARGARSNDVLLAADAIEELVTEMISLRATFELMVDDADDMNRIGAGVNAARIGRLLQLKETE